MRNYFDSVQKKVLFCDLLVIAPLLILFSVLMLFGFRDSNLSVNNSRLDVLEERCSNIAKSNDEIIRIMNAMSVNTDVNRIMSQKQEAKQYDYIKNNRAVQEKMLEITELFYNKQYQLMLLCENGTNYFQNTLEFNRDIVSLAGLKQEMWYEEMMTRDSASIYFLPRYRSMILQELFQEDMLFAVQSVGNINSGREVGILILAASQMTWDRDSQNRTSDETSVVIDQYGKVIFPFDFNADGPDVSVCDYYDRIACSDRGFFRGTIGRDECNIYFSGITGTGWKLISYEPYRQTWSLYTTLMGILELVTLAAIAFMVLFNCKFIYRRMRNINENILKVSEGNLHTRIQGNYEVEFQELCTNFNIMLDRIEELMAQLEQEEKEKYALEFQSLQAQINSHFLHNTLAAIRFMIQIGEYQNADRTVIAFSKLLRKSFADSRRITSVWEELEMAEEYMELMSLRYQNKFQWNITASADTRKLGILKNTLQPLVENSISHGFNMKQEMGHIEIRVTESDYAVWIEVEDDGVGADLDKIHACIENRDIPKSKERFSQIGLSNIQMRLQKNFGNEFGLEASLNSYGGVILKMKIPVIDLLEEEDIN